MLPEVEEFLRARGVTDAELAEVGAGRDVVELVLSRSVLPGARSYTLAGVAEQAGVEPEVAEVFSRALGFADTGDEVLYGEADVEALRAAALVVTPSMGIEQSVEQARVLGAALATVAESWTDVLVEHAREVFAAADRPDAAALALAQKMTTDLDGFAPVLVYVYRRQLVAAINRRLWWNPEGPFGDQVLAVGFADLSGFTALSQQLTGDELGDLVKRFDSQTRDLISEAGGRVVKSIGDEVMFVAPSALLAAHISVALVEANAVDELLPPVRVGFDHGQVLLRDGDVFGPTVNRAARLVDVARAGTVVIPSEVRDQLVSVPGLSVRPLGARRLKDVGLTWLWAVTRAA